MAAVASKPSISGICTSISTTSNDCPSRAASASRPLPATTTWWPRFSSTLTASLWLTGCPRPAGAGAARPPAGRGPRRRGGTALEAQRRAEGGHDRVEQGRLLDRLGQVGGDAQLAAAGGVLAPVGRRQHHQRRPGQLRVLPDPLGQGEAVHLRHHGVEQHQRERLRRPPRACSSAASACRPPSTTVGFIPQLVSISWRMQPVRGVVVHDQHGQAVDLGRLAPASAAAPARAPAEAGGEVERAALADLALHPDAPAHQLDQLGRDRQAQPGAAVLPGGRGVGLGERLEERLLLLGRDADAGVADGEVQARLLLRLRPRPRPGAPPRPAR